jgi:SAM-dependent methyltransferase
MNEVMDQYDVYPYPERNPEDEKKRLIVGSPSHPLEIDHFLFNGNRDWTKTIKILVAGGGSGDGLIQIGQLLTAAKCKYEITYLDFSKGARDIAEKRAAVRELQNITFITGDLMDAPKYGPFDYIDCCGVLHHLDDPVAGMAALSAALVDGGGLGGMVYAPLGRSGVYPLQDAFKLMLGDMPPKEKLQAARDIFDKLPDGHPFLNNPHLKDHQKSDAGFYDLLLHSQDRSYSVAELVEDLRAGGLELISFSQPGLYSLELLLPKNSSEAISDQLLPEQKMALAENLRGSIKTHIFYAAKVGQTVNRIAQGDNMNAIPHLKGINPSALAKHVAKMGKLKIELGTETVNQRVSKGTSRLIGLVDGRKRLSEIASLSGLNSFEFNMLWKELHQALVPWGLLLYSKIHRK